MIKLQTTNFGQVIAFWVKEQVVKQVFSCFYDSGNDVGGFVIKKSPDYWFSEIDLETLSDKIEKAKKDFFELTGQEGKLILTIYGR